LPGSAGKVLTVTVSAAKFLNGDLTCDISEEPADTAIIASGPITLVSTGEKAGIFYLLYFG
jgi:hypothetical protein